MEDTTITLTTHQLTLLGHLTAAVVATPDESRFYCGRLRRVGFTWIIHDGFYSDVRVANWDDVLALERFGLIELQLDDNDPDDCTFVLTDLARQVSAQVATTPLPQHGRTRSFDVQTLQSE